VAFEEKRESQIHLPIPPPRRQREIKKLRRDRSSREPSLRLDIVAAQEKEKGREKNLPRPVTSGEEEGGGGKIPKRPIFQKRKRDTSPIPQRRGFDGRTSSFDLFPSPYKGEKGGIDMWEGRRWLEKKVIAGHIPFIIFDLEGKKKEGKV